MIGGSQTLTTLRPVTTKTWPHILCVGFLYVYHMGDRFTNTFRRIYLALNKTVSTVPSITRFVNKSIFAAPSDVFACYRSVLVDTVTDVPESTSAPLFLKPFYCLTSTTIQRTTQCVSSQNRSCKKVSTQFTRTYIASCQSLDTY